MSDIEKAARDAVEAAQQADRYAEILAVVTAVQAAQHPGCQHPPAPVQQTSNGKWIAVGVAAPFLAITLAISVMAAAISAVALTICVLVLRGLWVDMQKGKKS